MATNPPIVIGPFTNVPAPGSGVKSDWCQQITTYVVPPAWIALPAYQNGWINYGAPYQVGQYRKRGDIVEVRGLIKSGTIGAVAFTMPAGFRPPADLLVPSNSAGAYCAITITAAGTVTPSAASNASVAIGFSYSVNAA